jgi:hypothetical protein
MKHENTLTKALERSHYAAIHVKLHAQRETLEGKILEAGKTNPDTTKKWFVWKCKKIWIWQAMSCKYCDCVCDIFHKLHKTRCLWTSIIFANVALAAGSSNKIIFANVALAAGSSNKKTPAFVLSFSHTMGRVIAQAVSHWLLTAAARVRARVR